MPTRTISAHPYLWRRLRCPIWCTWFTAAAARKLEDAGIQGAVVHVVTPGERFMVGPFDCSLLRVTHSIPESHALALRTPLGNVLHTGDWKLDPAPLVGPLTATDDLEAFGREGVLAMIADSTNILNPGTSGSEAEVRDSLQALIGTLENRVVLTTFASNIARLETALHVAPAVGRRRRGRAFHASHDRGRREVGYLQNVPPMLDERAASELPRNKVLWLATGCQGEPRAALSIAAGQHPSVRLAPGGPSFLLEDHPRQRTHAVQPAQQPGQPRHRGDHRARPLRARVRTPLPRRGRADVPLDPPQIAIPVHGEARHLHEHLAFARRPRGAPAVRSQERRSGAPGAGPAVVIDEVPTGRLVLENQELIAAEDELFRARRRLMNHGTVLVGLVLDRYGALLASPQVSTFGAADLAREPGLRDAVLREIEDAIEDLDDDAVLDDERIRNAARTAVRRSSWHATSGRSSRSRSPASARRPGGPPRRDGAGAMIGRLNHVAIAVPDLAAAAAQYRELLGRVCRRRSRSPRMASPPCSSSCPTPRSSCSIRSATSRRSPAFLSAIPRADSTTSATRSRTSWRRAIAFGSRRARAGRRRAQDRGARQTGAVPASQGLQRHPDRAGAGLNGHDLVRHGGRLRDRMVARSSWPVRRRPARRGRTGHTQRTGETPLGREDGDHDHPGRPGSRPWSHG